MSDFPPGSVWLCKTARTTADGSIKVRPAVVISNDSYNDKNEEVICLHLSTDSHHQFAIPLDYKKDMEKCELAEPSAIRYDIVARYSKHALVKKFGTIRKEKLAHAIGKFIELIKG